MALGVLLGTLISCAEDSEQTKRVNEEKTAVDEADPLLTLEAFPPTDQRDLHLETEITGDITPKSIVASGHGLFFAQNMMYEHTITVYDEEHRLVKTIPDKVKLEEFGFDDHPGVSRGAPVEAAFSPDGRYAYVSNYSMYGQGFGPIGSDTCLPSDTVADSFLYKIDTTTFEIAGITEVGAVPKYVAVTPDNKYVLVSNWCSYDLSVVDVESGEEIRRIDLGTYPRGIAVDSSAQSAYVAVYDENDIAKIQLDDFSVEWIRDVGNEPRHLVIDSEDRFLYATLNEDGKVIKIDLETDRIVDEVVTGTEPRSMVIGPDDLSLYVVNYGSSTLSKVGTRKMNVLQEVQTNYHPIGITYSATLAEVWVACYGGTIMVFQDG